VVLSLLLLARPALGANPRAQEKVARKACLIGDYKQGVSILADLFVETGKAVHIFNQGRCYEQSRRYEDALAKFEEFLRAAKGRITDEERAIAEQHIADCSERLRKEHLDSPAQPPLMPTPVIEPSSPPKSDPLLAASEPAVAVVQPTSAPATGARRWGFLTAGIVTSAVGAGSAVAGIIFNLKANDAAKKVETEAGAYPASSRDEKNFRTYAWIGYGTGAACLAAGAVMIVLGATKTSSGSSVDLAFHPTFGPGLTGAMITGGF
jgi:hypothetical protein